MTARREEGFSVRALPVADDLCDDFESLVDIGLGMSHGEEPGFVGAGGEVDALVEAAPEEFFKDAKILLSDRIDIHDVLIEEVEAKHGTDPVEAMGDSFLGQDCFEPVFHPFSDLVKTLEAVVVLEFAQLGQPCDHRERVA